MARSKGHIPGTERPTHPTGQAAILLIVVTLLIVGLAVLSSLGNP
jgi:hypothetical protein